MHLLFAAAMLAGTTSAAADRPVEPKPARGSPDEVVCRKETVTGTLASFRRICMTRAAWTRQSERSQAAADELDARGRLNACGGQVDANGCSAIPTG